MDIRKLVTRPYEDTNYNLGLRRKYDILGPIQTLLTVVAHGCHFLRYYVFSKDVKRCVRDRFRCERNVQEEGNELELVPL